MKTKRPLKVKDKKLKKVMGGGQGFMRTLFDSGDRERIILTAALSPRKAREDTRRKTELFD